MDAGRAVSSFEKKVVEAINGSGLHPVVAERKGGGGCLTSITRAP